MYYSRISVGEKIYTGIIFLIFIQFYSDENFMKVNGKITLIIVGVWVRFSASRRFLGMFMKGRDLSFE